MAFPGVRSLAMKGITQLASGKYRVRPMVDGRRQSHVFETEHDAAMFLRALKGLAPVPPEAPAEVRYDQWVASWFGDHAPTVKSSTAYRYKKILNLYVLPHFGLLTLSQITPAVVRGWQTKLLGEGLSANTLKLARTVFGMTLKAAAIDGLMTTNPLAGVRPVRVPKKQVRILTEPEVHELAAAIHPRWRALILMASYCGLRIGELCALRLEDVDLVEHKLTVSRTVTKGLEGWGEGSAKTDYSLRSIAMPKFLVRELEQHLSDGHSSDYLLFTGTRGGQLGPNHFRKFPWSKALRVSGLGPLRPHDLRHTAISLWIRQGASPRLVAYRAGHRSVGYVLDTYGHLFDDEDGELAARLDVGALMEGAGPGPDAHSPGPATDVVELLP